MAKDKKMTAKTKSPGAGSSSDGKGKKMAKKQRAPMDPRFDTSSDPRFKMMPKKETKVKVDSRFKAMFGKEFAEPSAVDRMGRKTKSKTNTDMKQFYELDEDDVSADDEKSTTVAGQSMADSDDEGAFRWDQESSDESEDDLIVGEKVEEKN